MASFLSEEEYILIIMKTLNTSDFKLVEVKQKSLSEGESGMLGEHFKIEITVLLGNSSERLHLYYFLKLMPKEEDVLTEFVNSTKANKKEFKFYSTLFDVLKKQHFRVMDLRNKKSFWSSICYLTREDAIVLEDLSASGFRTHGTRNPLDYDHCAAVLRTLACFHAASIVYEEKELITRGLNLNQLHSDIFFETLCVKDRHHLGYIYCQTALKGMLELCKYLPNFGKNHKHHEYIQRSLLEISNQIYELVKPSEKFRNVMCHCDLWANNIMFRYGSTGKPEEARLVDFQLMRYCPPAHDITLFLHLTTTRKFRQIYMEELLDLYYKTFSEELELYHLQAQNLLPWTELQVSCEEYSVIALIFTAVYFHNGLMDSSKIKDIITHREKLKEIIFQDKTDFLFQAFKNDPAFRERFIDAAEELIECCILNRTNTKDLFSNESINHC